MSSTYIAEMGNGSAVTNLGPITKEAFMEQAEQAFDADEVPVSVFYQVRSMFQTFQERYKQIEPEEDLVLQPLFPEELMSIVSQMNEFESKDIETNTLLQFTLKTLKETSSCQIPFEPYQIGSISNFLRNVDDAKDGVRKIEEVCQQLPKEWTVLQLCKGYRADNTYAVFPEINTIDAAIYVTVLRHPRSACLPDPICLRFDSTQRKKIFKKFADISIRFKEAISINPKDFATKESRKVYWSTLEDINQKMRMAIDELRDFFYPWNFLFTGRPFPSTVVAGNMRDQFHRRAFNAIDQFCLEHKWSNKNRVLMSLAAIHIDKLSELEIQAVPCHLSFIEQERTAATKLLQKLRTISASLVFSNNSPSQPQTHSSHYPCILIVDENLDHFFWEELNVVQEFCRVNSLQCLWHLYRFHKTRVQNGYLKVKITEGTGLVNPGDNLPRMELRMRQFLNYWIPHWLIKFREKPNVDDYIELLQSPCYIYVGHGSGMQYFSGKYIAKQLVKSVVFLFGCESTRLHSNGLYSDLVGPHVYYHAAMCPTTVGTLMPALDSNIDVMSAEILSRWITPKSRTVTPWHEIDMSMWVKEAIVKPRLINGKPPRTMSKSPEYNTGSLCAILSMVHQRKFDSTYYNTVLYVCRGLPVWNCCVKPLPK